MGVAAFVVRDHTGTLVDGKISFYPCSLPTMVEAKAIYDASLFAASCVCEPVIIESDCKIVIDAISSDASFLPWDDSGMVEAIRDVANKSSSISYSFIYREANTIAHWVASSAKCGSLPPDWLSRQPLVLSRLLLFDREPQGIG